MKHIEPWQKWSFIGALALIALVINSSSKKREAVERQRQQQIQNEQQTKMETQKAAQDEAAKFEEYLRQYVNSGFSRKLGKKTIAIVSVSQNGSFNNTINTALIRRFSGDGAEIYSSFFTPKFVSDGLFASVLHGSTEPISKLKLSGSVDGLLLSYQQAEFSTNSALENLITANVRLKVMTLPTVANGQNKTWTFTANGPGFHTEDALQMAEERIVKQISMDTKMSLNQISPNNRN